MKRKGINFHILFMFCFLFTQTVFLPAQTTISAKILQGTWLTENGTFPDSLIRLRAINPNDSDHIYYAYTFDENGTVELAVRQPRGLLICGNGTPHLRRGTWVFKNKSLRITLTGTYFAAGTFTYDLLYKAEELTNLQFASGGMLLLTKTKTYKNVRCTNCRK